MSNKINTFKNAISKYIEIDEKITKNENANDVYITKLKDKIKEIEKPVKELKTQKTMLFDYIIKTMEQSDIKDKTIKIKIKENNYTLKCEKDEKKKDSLTQKFIKETLINYHKESNYGKLSEERCEQKALEQFQYLLNARNTKETITLVYDKNM